MNVTADQESGKLVICISGELDHHAAQKLMREIEKRIDLGLPRECVIDMSQLSFMDSSGIAVVLRSYKRMREISGKLTVEQVPRQALRVLDAAGVGLLVDVTAQK